jgi:glucose/arabinose dehydrogenase
MSRFMRRAVLLVLTVACFAVPAAAAAQSVQLAPFGGTTFPSPFFVTGEPGNPSRVYVVQGTGQIRLVVNGTTQAGNFLDINTDVFDRAEGSCECGMFSMAFAPDYATSGLFYVFYTRDVPVVQHELVIREFRRTTNPNNIDESTGRDVLVIPHPNASNHNGGQLQFGPDGLLYIATGDGGSTPQLGQSLTTLLGKILRINPAGTNPSDYSIPASNPFVDGEPGGAEDEIYSYGLRNPYRFSFDRLTGDLIVADVGQSEWEEIDFLPSSGGLGANFGWRCFEGPDVFVTSGECNPPLANHTPPVHWYLNPPATGAAINGGYVVRDGALPTLLGRYLYADSSGAFPEIRSISLFPGGSSGDSSTGLSGGTASFGEDACGHIYVARFNNTVSRIQPTSGPFPCAPQTAPLTPLQLQSGDSRGPGLSVDTSRAKRAGARGEVSLFVGCDEPCTVQGAGEIVMRGKDIGLDPDTLSIAVGIEGEINLDLSRKEARRLLAALDDGWKAKAVVELTAADSLGNSAVAERSIKQKR